MIATISKSDLMIINLNWSYFGLYAIQNNPMTIKICPKVINVQKQKTSQEVKQMDVVKKQVATSLQDKSIIIQARFYGDSINHINYYPTSYNHQNLTQRQASLGSIAIPLYEYKISQAVNIERDQCQYIEGYQKFVANYGITMLHLYSYFSQPQYLKRCLDTEGAFIHVACDYTISPIKVAIKRSNSQCVNTILEFIVENPSQQCLIYRTLGDDLIKLNLMNLQILPEVYKAALIKPSVPVHNYLTLSKSKKVVIKEIENTSGKKVKQAIKSFRKGKNENRVEILVSAIRFQFENGSQKSLQFLRSLDQTANYDIFRAPIIQAYLNHKWNHAKKIVFSQAIIYILLILLISLHICYFRQNLVLLGLIFGINFILIWPEIMQIISMKCSYFRQPWNWFDIFRVGSVWVYVVFRAMWKQPTQIQETQLKILLLIVIVFVIFKGISYFRVLKSTRYLIRMIVQIIQDMIPFLIILGMATYGSFLLYVAVENDSDLASFNYEGTFFHVFLLNFADFFTKEYNSYQILIFSISAVFLPLVMLNLLIAIMGDTYDRVQDNMMASDYKQITNQVLEYEALLIHKRKKRRQSHFVLIKHAAIESREESIFNWEGRVRAIKERINKVSEEMIQHKKDISSSVGLSIDIGKKIMNQISKTNQRLEKIETKIGEIQGRMQEVS